MTRTIAIANHKGGVGKTATAFNVGSILANKGYNVLLVDLDAQSNLTASLIDEEPDVTIYDALRNNTPLPVHNVRERLDLVPSSLNLAGVEIELNNRLQRESVLKRLLKPLTARYDFVVIDCAPALGLLTINALTASTDVIIPLTCEIYPLKGLKMLTDIIDEVRDALNPELNLMGIALTKYDRRRVLTRDVESAITDAFGDTVFKTRIRNNVDIAESPDALQDVTTYNPRSTGAVDYTALTDEVVERCNLKKTV